MPLQFATAGSEHAPVHLAGEILTYVGSMTASWVLQTCLLLTCLQQLVAAANKPDSQTIFQQQPHSSPPNTTQQAYQPAITGIATTTLFAYASKVALEVVEDQFDKLDLPDTSSSWDIPVIGTINLDLSRIVLKSLDISAATTGVAPNQQGGVTFIVIGLRTTVDCHFHYYKDTFPKVSGSGDAEVQFEDGNVEFMLIPKADAKGRPMIISQGPAKVSFGDIDVRTSHSKAAWLYNLFLNVFEGQFRGVITREVARYAIPASITLYVSLIPFPLIHPLQPSPLPSTPHVVTSSCTTPACKALTHGVCVHTQDFLPEFGAYTA